MSERPWYKRYPADFVHGCLGLSLEEKGAYSICLDLIYDRGGGIPDDARWLAGVCGVSVRKWTALRARLIAAGKLVESDGKLTNYRADKEIENAAKATRKLSENGAKGGNKSAENRSDVNEIKEIGIEGLKHTRINQKPESISHTPPKPPEGGSLEVLVERLIGAAGGNVVHGAAGIEVLKPILDLQAMGCDLERDILPAIAEAVPKMQDPLRTWGARFLRDSILAKHAARLRGRGASPPTSEPDWPLLVSRFQAKGSWPASLGPAPGFSGCRAPPGVLAEHGFGVAAA